MSKEKLSGTSTIKGKESSIRIINIMADGRVVNDLTGYVVPVNEKTKVAYNLLAKHIQEKSRNA